MNMKIDFVKDVNEKFYDLEYELEKKLKLVENAEEKFEASEAERKKNSDEFTVCPTLEEALIRNRKIIEDMEQARARLRSLTIYSPLDEILEKSKRNYAATLTTPVKKNIYGPIFV